jgi:hypothetical protein
MLSMSAQVESTATMSPYPGNPDDVKNRYSQSTRAGNLQETSAADCSGVKVLLRAQYPWHLCNGLASAVPVAPELKKERATVRRPSSSPQTVFRSQRRKGHVE